MHRVTKRYLKNKWPGDHRMHELIDYIDPALYWLYQEYLNSPDAPIGELKWKRNIVDLQVKMVNALGHGHELHGNLSVILGGYGSVTRSYRETLMGSFPVDLLGTYDSWNPTDRLWAVGNGTDANNRNDALRMYKSGYTVFNNSIQIGNFSWGANNPGDGAFRYTAGSRFEGWFNGQWNPFLTTESDPVFSNSPAASITNTHIANWNAAYNWGDHSLAGYITSLAHSHGVANAAGTQQFLFAVGENIRFEGTGATSVSFDAGLRKVILSSTDTNTTYSDGNGISLSGTQFSVSAGNGLLQQTSGLALGTPATISVSSSNGVTTSSHTHSLDLSGRSVLTQYSITGGGSLGGNRTLNLVGDVALPGNSKYYGTNGAGTRGWHSLPAGATYNGGIGIDVSGSDINMNVLKLSSTNLPGAASSYYFPLAQTGGAHYRVAFTTLASYLIWNASSIGGIPVSDVPSTNEIMYFDGTDFLFTPMPSSLWTLGSGYIYPSSTSYKVTIGRSGTPLATLDVAGDIALRTNTFLGFNTYYSSGWKYMESGYASLFKQETDGFMLYLAQGSGTAGAAQTHKNVKFENSTGNIIAANFVLNSLRKLKSAIQHIDELEKFGKIPIYQFYYKSDETRRTRFGVIAEEVEKLSSNLVYVNETGDKQVAYIDLLVAKVARLEQIVEQMESRWQ